MNAIRTRADLRAAVTRGFFEQQQAKLGARAIRAILPRQITPISTGRVAAVLSSEIDDPATNAARSAALAGLAHRSGHDLLPALLGERFVDDSSDGDSHNRCPCCLARRKAPGPEAQVVGRIDGHETAVEFDPDSLLTTVTTTIRVAAEWVNWPAFVEGCDPANWKNVGSKYFRQSEPIVGTVKLRTGKTQGWVGRLHENFDWNWNEDSEAMFDNDLNIDFSHGGNGESKTLRCDYNLYRSNASKVWVARESGGLDVDGGYTEATLTRQWLEVTATKQIRFTDPELGPPGLGAMLNYLAPTVTGLWMNQAVQAGVEKSIRLQPVSQSWAKKAPRPRARPTLVSTGHA